MEYLIGALWNGLELLACLLLAGAFLPLRKKKWYRVVALAGAWLLICVCSNLEIDQIIIRIAAIVIVAAASLALFSGKWYIHVLLAVLSWVFLMIFDTLIVNGMCAILHLSYEQLIGRMWLFVILTTIDKMLATFFAWLTRKLRHRNSFETQSGRWVVMSILFPLTSTLMFMTLFYGLPQDQDVSAVVVVFSVILLVANVAMLYVISSIEKAAERERDAQALRQQISLQSQSYQAMKENYVAQRKMTHEFERHLQVMRDLLDHCEYDVAQDYVRRLQNNRAVNLYNISTNNPVVDVVLNQKYQTAKEHGIKMHIEVNDLSSLPIPNDDLVVALANLLDNAIEACLKVEKSPEILCSMIHGDDLYLSVSNTSQPVEIVGGEIATTKRDASNHGYGLPAVKLILDKLQAEYTFAYSDGWFQFVAEIPCQVG